MRQHTLRGPYGAASSSAPRTAAPQGEAWRERRAQLQALTQSPEWQRLVTDGLRGQLQRLKDSLALGFALTEQQIREKQGQARLLQELIERPATYLAHYDENTGDER